MKLCAAGCWKRRSGELDLIRLRLDKVCPATIRKDMLRSLETLPEGVGVAER